MKYCFAIYNNSRNNVDHIYDNLPVYVFNSDFQSISIAFAVYSGSAHVENSTAVASANADYNRGGFGAYALGKIVWDGGSLSAMAVLDGSFSRRR